MLSDSRPMTAPRFGSGSASVRVVVSDDAIENSVPTF
jgi:hypothetical protein